jgi:hypothetical protein
VRPAGRRSCRSATGWGASAPVPAATRPIATAKDTRRGEAAAILKSETKGRVKPMTEAEFIAAYAREERLLKDAGAPLIRLDMGGADEKQARIAAHMARMNAVVTATARKDER